MTKCTSPWAKGTIYDGKISGANNIEKGEAEFSSLWTDYNRGVAPPSPLLVGRADGVGTPRILCAHTRPAGPEEKRYGETLQKLPEAQRLANIVISVTPDFYDKMAIASDATKGYVVVRFKTAGFGLRVKYVPGAKWALIAAILSFLASVATAVAALVSGITKPSAPLWWVVFVAAAAVVAASVTFAVNVRDKTKAG
jgi:hypothetical protein